MRSACGGGHAGAIPLSAKSAGISTEVVRTGRKAPRKKADEHGIIPAHSGLGRRRAPKAPDNGSIPTRIRIPGEKMLRRSVLLVLIISRVMRRVALVVPELAVDAVGRKQLLVRAALDRSPA